MRLIAYDTSVQSLGPRRGFDLMEDRYRYMYMKISLHVRAVWSGSALLVFNLKFLTNLIANSADPDLDLHCDCDPTSD
jgi:hypothetical protein